MRSHSKQARPTEDEARRLTRQTTVTGLQQEFITPHCPQQNGMVESVILTLKEQCVHRHRFGSIPPAARAIGDWIQFYKTGRSLQVLAVRTPVEEFLLEA